MQCYDCAAQTKAADAVGICVLCGRGVCLQHAQLQHLPQFRNAGTGMGGPVVRSAHDRPRLVCRECAAAVGPREPAKEE